MPLIHSALNLWNFSCFPAMQTFSMIIYNGWWQRLLSKEVCGYIQIRCHQLGSNKNFTGSRLKTLRKWMWSFRRQGLGKVASVASESQRLDSFLTNYGLCFQNLLLCCSVCPDTVSQNLLNRTCFIGHNLDSQRTISLFENYWVCMFCYQIISNGKFAQIPKCWKYRRRDWIVNYSLNWF